MTDISRKLLLIILFVYLTFLRHIERPSVRPRVKVHQRSGSDVHESSLHIVLNNFTSYRRGCDDRRNFILPYISHNKLEIKTVFSMAVGLITLAICGRVESEASAQRFRRECATNSPRALLRFQLAHKSQV